MSIKNQSKDHIAQHAGVELVPLAALERGSDPLKFWTNHPTENFLVDLSVFAIGEDEPPTKAPWSGPFSGRAQLIAELAPALEARLTFATVATCRNYTFALRTFWRLFDQLESKSDPSGRVLQRLVSVRELTALHELAAKRNGVDSTRFGHFLSVANDTRRRLRLGLLPWTIPKPATPERLLIPEDQAKEIRLAVKRAWRSVVQRWQRHDAIRRGELPQLPSDLQSEDPSVAVEYADENLVLQRNWAHFEKCQQRTGKVLPSVDELLDGVARHSLRYHDDIDTPTMRAIAFPTVEEADIAFHMALIGSGWNPSTLIVGVDASTPDRVIQHPKDAKQNVLVLEDPDANSEEFEEVAMQGSKRRAGGRLQFCYGLKKNPASPPNVVAAFLERTSALREELQRQCNLARTKLDRLRDEKAPASEIDTQFRHYQTLQQGVRNVWLYVDTNAKINWLDGKEWARYRVSYSKKKVSYLDRVVNELNDMRSAPDEPQIPRIVPSDLRDIFARWVHVQSGGNVLAVMHALGHGSLRSTDVYLTNNIFNAESDDTVRRFMAYLFEQLEQGRIDLTILAQLVRHGSLTPEMESRLSEYRALLRSRINVACADPKHPPPHIDPSHEEGKWCRPQHCLRRCPHARFLPESLDGIAMRVEELAFMAEALPLETWMQGSFEAELREGEYLLDELYANSAVESARARWRDQIASGKHVVPGLRRAA
jgi:hypothetical protein